MNRSLRFTARRIEGLRERKRIESIALQTITAHDPDCMTEPGTYVIDVHVERGFCFQSLFSPERFAITLVALPSKVQLAESVERAILRLLGRKRWITETRIMPIALDLLK